MLHQSEQVLKFAVVKIIGFLHFARAMASMSPEKVRQLIVTDNQRKRCAEAKCARDLAKRAKKMGKLLIIPKFGVLLKGNTYFCVKTLRDNGFEAVTVNSETTYRLQCTNPEFHVQHLKYLYAANGVELDVSTGNETDVYSQEQLDFLHDPKNQHAITQAVLAEDNLLLTDAQLAAIPLPGDDTDTSMDIGSPRSMRAMPHLYAQAKEKAQEIAAYDKHVKLEVRACYDRMTMNVAAKLQNELDGREFRFWDCKSVLAKEDHSAASGVQ